MTPDTIREAVALGAGVFSMIMLLASITKMRQEMYVPLSAPVIAIAVTGLAAGIYIALTGAQVNWALAGLVLAAGAVIGLIEGRVTRLYYRGPIIFGKRSTAYLVIWGLAYLLTLLLSQIGSALMQAVSVLVLAFGLGMALGDNVTLLIRQATLKRPAGGTAPPAPPALPSTPPSPPSALTTSSAPPPPPSTLTPATPPPPPPANRARRNRGCLYVAGCLIALLILACLVVMIVIALSPSGGGA